MEPRRTCHEMCSMEHPGRGTASVRVSLRALSVVPAQLMSCGCLLAHASPQDARRCGGEACFLPATV